MYIILIYVVTDRGMSRKMGFKVCVIIKMNGQCGGGNRPTWRRHSLRHHKHPHLILNALLTLKCQSLAQMFPPAGVHKELHDLKGAPQDSPLIPVLISMNKDQPYFKWRWEFFKAKHCVQPVYITQPKQCHQFLLFLHPFKWKSKESPFTVLPSGAAGVMV